MPLVSCMKCNSAISADAGYCRHCGCILPKKKWEPVIAFILSLLVPGLGQLYKGEAFTALCFFVIVPLGYLLFVIPGIILHIVCICEACMGDPYERESW